jgi:hypothetical protein
MSTVSDRVCEGMVGQVSNEIEEYPSLPVPALPGSPTSPYSPLYPSLIVDKAEVSQLSPWTAMLERIKAKIKETATKKPKKKKNVYNKPAHAHKERKDIGMCAYTSSYKKVNEIEVTSTTYVPVNRFSCLTVEQLPSEIESDEHFKNTQKKTVNEKEKRKSCKRDQYQYKVEVFGKDTILMSNYNFVTRAEIKTHAEELTSRKTVRNIIVTCNGNVNFGKIYPKSKIIVSTGLVGGGRKKLDLHDGKPCASCFLCKNGDTTWRYVHLVRKQEKDLNFVEYVNSKYVDIKQDSCLCRKCEMRILREMKPQPADVGPRKKPRRDCAASVHLGISDCDKVLVQSDWNLNTVAEGLLHKHTMQLDEDFKVVLCKKHYNVVYDRLKKRSIKCCVCEKSLNEKKGIHRHYMFSFSGCDEETYNALSSNASGLFKKTLNLSNNSNFCRTCYYPLMQIISQEKELFRNDAVHTTLLLDIVAEHPVEDIIDIIHESGKSEKLAFDHTVNYLAQQFLEKRVIVLKQLHSYYIKKTNCFGLLRAEDKDIKTENKLLYALQLVFKNALVVMNADVHGKCIGKILHWNGNDQSVALANRIVEESIANECLKEQIEALKQQLEMEKAPSTSDSVILDRAVNILRGKVKRDANILKEKKSIDLNLVDFCHLVSQSVSPELWNFLSTLTMNETCFQSFKKDNHDPKKLLFVDCLTKIDKQRFLKVFFSYSHCLYIYSNGVCNKPLHIFLGDVMDKFTKSSSECLDIFNSFGIVIGKDTLDRYQVQLASIHENNAPYNDIDRYSFAYASLDNLDFLSKNAHIKASSPGRGCNCTTVMAGQPQPLALRWNDEENTQVDLAAELSSNRPRKRKFENDCQYKASTTVLSNSEVPAIQVKYEDLKVSLAEDHAFNNMKCDIFKYCCIKYASSKEEIENTEKCMPSLKVFMARKDDKQIEKSAKSYISITDDCCDSLATVESVLRTLFVKMEVGKHISHLVVAGDAKVYDYLLKIKDQDPTDYAWLIPFMGDWHTMKNYACSLLKIYGPAGLEDLIGLLHKGRTEKGVRNCTDFEKTFAFFMQSWESMYRLEIDMFLQYLEQGSDEGAAAAFSKDVFVNNVSSKMRSWKNANDTTDSYINALMSIDEDLQGLNEEFDRFVHKMCKENENFRFWSQYIHKDCMAFICLYLAGRSANWDLRNYALKSMMPLFHVVNSTFYYRLLPRHLTDIVKMPRHILSSFQAGAFAMSLSGKNWSSMFLDETHESTINLQIKEIARSLSPASLKAKMHYLPYRASLYHHFMAQVRNWHENARLAKDTAYHARINEENVAAYSMKLKDSIFAKVYDVKELCHLFSEQIATQTVHDSLLNFRSTADVRTEDYIKCCITKELSMREGKKRPYILTTLKNFGENIKITRKEKDMKQFYSSSTKFLTKIIQWCKSNNIPPSDIEQFIKIPLAIATPDGIPIKKQKADACKYMMKHFGSAFTESVACKKPKTLIIDGMVVIYTNKPLSSHNTFGDYAAYLFRKWISHNFMIKGYVEIHVCFDRQLADIVSPKCIERNRRDGEKSKTESKIYQEINEKSQTPYHWFNFLANRSNKKIFVDFLCRHFIKLGGKLLDSSHILIVSGGFKAAGTAQMVMRVVEEQEEEEFPLRPFFNNHVEADTMMFLHAVNCAHSSDPIVIYSSDTDIMHIGLLIVNKYPNIHLIVHFKASAGQNLYVDLNELLHLLSMDIELRLIDPKHLPSEIQSLFICSGCDYVSFFRHFSKAVFYDAYFNNIRFISGDTAYEGMLSDTDPDNWHIGFQAFCRLIGCVYIKKCALYFQYKLCFKKRPSPIEIYEKIRETSSKTTEQEILNEWLSQIRYAITQTEGCQSEDFWLPSDDSLQLHWQRSCYALQIWQQADVAQIKYPDIINWGWAFDNNELMVVWDSDANFTRIEQYRKLWTQGCKCRSFNKPCNNKICGCKKDHKPCGPGCACSEHCKNKPIDPTINTLMQVRFHDDDDNETMESNLYPLALPSDDDTVSDNSEFSEDDQL